MLRCELNATCSSGANAWFIRRGRLPGTVDLTYHVVHGGERWRWVSVSGLRGAGPWLGLHAVANLRRLGDCDNWTSVQQHRQRPRLPVPTTRPRLLHSPPHPHPSLRNSADLPSMSQTQQMEPSDSISSQDPNREDSKKTKSRRPPSKPGLRMRMRLQLRAQRSRAALIDAQTRRFASSD